MVDLSRLMQDAAILEVIDKSADEARSLSAQNSYQAMRIEELERELTAAQEEKATLLMDAIRNAQQAQRAEEALKAAVAHERERAAKVCEDFGKESTRALDSKSTAMPFNAFASEFAAAIRKG